MRLPSNISFKIFRTFQSFQTRFQIFVSTCQKPKNKCVQNQMNSTDTGFVSNITLVILNVTVY